MTWGSPCEVETFLLKVLSVNADGTTSVTMSVPCEAGASTEVCMVQYDIDLPNPTEALVPPGKEDPPVLPPGASRHLLDTRQAGQSPTRPAQVGDAAVPSRRLQSTTQIDVMFLYSDASLTRVVNGATAAQMESLIANELPKATEAAVNSDIDLQFNLVHAGPLPYQQASLGAASANSELSFLSTNADVKDLRDTHGADLVVLVGSFSGTCGLGYINFNTQVSDEDNGFSLIDARCFEGKTTTHEMGHNLGCLHDLANNGFDPANDYSHGLRYCTGTGTRFHTIMAYSCDYNAEQGYIGDFVPALNHFSNPDVSYLGQPTGTATADNARTVRENMEAVSKFRIPCTTDSDCTIYGTCVNGACGTSECASVGGTVNYIGIGYCWAPNNNPECAYDGGDCCECDCTPGGPNTCGVNGYNCLNPYSDCFGDCEIDDDCSTGEICCPDKKKCEMPLEGTDPAACGDPHMTGFLGQKFDFTGVDGEWYCLIKDDNIQISMRVTNPIPSVPEITYITGLSVLTTDAEGAEHDIVINVKDPHSLESSCPEGVSPCLADGSLSVYLDGKEELLAPGTVSVSQEVAVSAVNLPGECRSFGFETYWERKKMEAATQGRRSLLGKEQEMEDWILGDPTATNMEECIKYVTGALKNVGGLFAHQSEHATFQIVTPKATIRLTHGRLHQIAMRDPTDQFDLPDHLTWQMNMGVDRNDVSRQATGILGQTFVPTLDAAGKEIMSGMESIRGQQEDYRLKGPLDVEFAQDGHSF
ncbi:unnamed protein product [Ectocarpus sp. 4 AP-2014]